MRSGGDDAGPSAAASFWVASRCRPRHAALEWRSRQGQLGRRRHERRRRPARHRRWAQSPRGHGMRDARGDRVAAAGGLLLRAAAGTRTCGWRCAKRPPAIAAAPHPAPARRRDCRGDRARRTSPGSSSPPTGRTRSRSRWCCRSWTTARPRAGSRCAAPRSSSTAGSRRTSTSACGRWSGRRRRLELAARTIRTPSTSRSRCGATTRRDARRAPAAGTAGRAEIDRRRRAAGALPRGASVGRHAGRRRGGQARARRRLRVAARPLRDPSARAIARAERVRGRVPDARAGTSSTRAAAGGMRAGRPRRPARSSTCCCERASRSSTASSSTPALRRIDVARGPRVPGHGAPRGGRPDLAAVLVRAYRDAGGDPGSDALLAFFAAYRAQVRAKVALTRGSAARAGAAAAARGRPRHRAAARSASGCSWAARTPLVDRRRRRGGLRQDDARARRSRTSPASPHLNSDVVRKRRAGLAPTDRAPASRCTPRGEPRHVRRAGTPRRRGLRAPASSSTRRSGNRSDRDAFCERCADGRAVLVVECRAPEPTCCSRARARAQLQHERVSDAGPDVVRAQLRDPRAAGRGRCARPRAGARRPAGRRELVAAIADALDRRLVDQ